MALTGPYKICKKQVIIAYIVRINNMYQTIGTPNINLTAHCAGQGVQFGKRN